mmetsp:Transcript_17357/g.15315  ORF Transcript_17357/g.15315 Transcript_17357/m.15315 type:complete len:96 (-) Transcript_17357:47-334(-)
MKNIFIQKDFELRPTHDPSSFTSVCIEFNSMFMNKAKWNLKRDTKLNPFLTKGLKSEIPLNYINPPVPEADIPIANRTLTVNPALGMNKKITIEL